MNEDKETIEMTPSRSSRTSKKKRGGWRVILLIVSYLIVGFGVWKIAQQSPMTVEEQQAAAEKEVKMVVADVKKLMLVPDTEIPQVATISDAEGLAKTQAFFIDVKNGDKVLIYLQAQKAIIYRPSENKIVNVGPVVTDNSATGTNTTNRPAGSTTSTNTSTTRSTSTPATSTATSTQR